MKKFLKWYIPLFLAAALIILIVYKTNLFKPEDTAVETAQQNDSVSSILEDSPTVEPPELNEGDDKGITTGVGYSGKLVEEGSRNVLIIGEDKMNDLYDTIGIASIDEKNGKLKLIMIPRDTYIEYGGEVADYLNEVGKSKSPGIYKINCAHLIGSMVKYKGKFKSGPTSFLAQVIKEKFGIDVDDYVKINTSGFASMVDLFGGIDIKVPYLMNYDDPTQDLHIHLAKGMQHLDGAQAEGFVRYRQGFREDGTYFEIGDPGRKKNQLDFLQAFIKQHGTISQIDKIPQLMQLLGKNVQHSIGVGDVLQVYIKLAKDIILSKFQIESENLDGKQTKINGSSYLMLE
jgi:polyisoprenyl-teichoic acid--peptidoglycan teichoic acid transferase